MKVTFENATIADSIAKAARVAPTKGTAFDKASGIIMELNPDDNTVTLKATNLDVYYLEIVDTLEVTDAGTWRLPSQITSQIMSKLPIGSGRNVTIEQSGKEIHLKSGRTVVKLRDQSYTDYPKWDAYDPADLDLVVDLGARIKQVDWAASTDPDSAFAGIHMTGQYALATDSIRLVRVPCEAKPIYKPVTIPAGILNPIITNLRDVAIGIEEGSFLLMPDGSTQIRTVMYGRKFPSDRILPVFDREWPDMIEIKKASLLEIIDRASIMTQRDRTPQMLFYIGKEELAVQGSDAELGLLGDVISLDGQADHPRTKMIFTPKNIQQALEAAPSESVSIWYDKADSHIPVKVDGGSGYEAVIMPRRDTSSGGS